MLFSKKKHWFAIQIGYLKNSNNLAQYSLTVPLTKRSDILDNRKVHKMVGDIVIKNIPKQLLCNGYFIFETSCYLGKFYEKDINNE